MNSKIEEKTFKQSITRFGSILRPDKITINDTKLIWEKRNKNLINVDSKSFEIEKITSVEIDSTLLGTKITIRTIAGDDVTIDKFTLSDAEEIRDIVHNIQQRKNKPDVEARPQTSKSVVDELLKLKELLDADIIDAEEFKKLKEKIINN